MGKLLVALGSLALMLCLPAWINGEPYLVLHQSNFKQLSSYTEPYHELMKRVSLHAHPKKEETMIVSAWQDSDGNMHFTEQGQQVPEQQVRDYQVTSHYTGRLAFPSYWVWATMAVVWLVFYIIGRLSISLMAQGPAQVRQARTVDATDRETKTQTTHRHIEYENSTSSKSSLHQTLGTHENASLEEIKMAYHSKMKQYHPDKVAHLGQELQDLARQKATKINQAYAELTKPKK